MVIAINVMQPVLVIILSVIFLGLLVTRDTRKAKPELAIIFLIVTILIAFSISDALRWYSIPIGPPPEIWFEGYYDSLFMRTYAYQTAADQSIILLILSISVVCKKWYEQNNTESKSTHSDAG